MRLLKKLISRSKRKTCTAKNLYVFEVVVTDKLNHKVFSRRLKLSFKPTARHLSLTFTSTLFS